MIQEIEDATPEVLSRSDKAELELDRPYLTSDRTGETSTRKVTSCASGFTTTVFTFPGLQYLTTESWQST